MDEGRAMVLLFPAIIDMSPEERLAWRTEEGESGKRPCHIFYAERVIDVKDGLKKWKGLDEKSDLVEEDDEERFQNEAESSPGGNS
ncbi:hypothetical protein FA15DRAFT_669648 [Coprinopsis marcescibilis]|uniref:Uncharacterized protein n=1 Tax=Coprinopsis marcescibilis TaxID=230819 RepID=A0A5C3KVD1_COPMA|nr:hypothetical protein FA15DRAFT_669648 [Coprinopsis marcescibilis]